jgi:hypothetical protein
MRASLQARLSHSTAPDSNYCGAHLGFDCIGFGSGALEGLNLGTGPLVSESTRRAGDRPTFSPCSSHCFSRSATDGIVRCLSKLQARRKPRVFVVSFFVQSTVLRGKGFALVILVLLPYSRLKHARKVTFTASPLVPRMARVAAFKLSRIICPPAGPIVVQLGAMVYPSVRH